MLVRDDFCGMDPRGFINMFVGRISYYQMIVAAAVATSLLLVCMVAPTEDDDPRLLPLLVCRNLRVMAIRLLPPSRYRPMRRFPACDEGLRAAHVPNGEPRNKLEDGHTLKGNCICSPYLQFTNS
jgi:hypothetical protein